MKSCSKVKLVSVPVSGKADITNPHFHWQAVYNSGKASVQARLVLLEIIKIFAENNWRLAANVNLESTADSLVFQWCPNLDMDDFRFCAISLNRYDRVRLMKTPSGLVGAIKVGSDR